MSRGIRAVGRTEDGFTLIELLIVIVILGVLAGVTVFAVQAFNKEGQTAACKADKKNVEVAAEAYLAKNGTKAADIAALVAANYLKELPSTGNGYTITYDGTTGVVTATGACT
ncbi:type II secretion system protein [Lentzea nigeriaca]|uniref:type II secretion system protein n=1 Tax=Lentzea nigeriaca TaxID=1128665 RepID=UPI00195C35A0|nr:prepilin-type N-terminal cleavage/methylation domain-containing protein [Lentzea nigeriaca]MBM7865099.1 general secretion pathway protein G [Lentzea nigeriaca]